MSTASVLARGQAAALALMVDTCSIQRRTGQFTDDFTGAVTPTLAPVYAGVCKLQGGGKGLGDRVQTGEATAVVLRLELHLPVVAASAGVARGDLVTCTASAHDPALVGRTFLVRDLAHKSWLTARRFDLEELT